MIRIAVLQDPRALLEREIVLALERADMQAHCLLWHECPDNLSDFDGFVFIGHDKNAPSIAPDPVLMQMIKEQSELGKLVLGIGKGAQILIETGLVPGLERHQVGMTIKHHPEFHDANSKIRVRLAKGYQWNAFTRLLKPKTIFQMPISHAHGRLVISSVLLAEIERNGLHVFQYCNEQGAIVNDKSVNPYGSVNNIAAIANKAGNVMAMLPHPETTLQGDAIFKSMREYISGGYVTQPLTLDYQPRV